jgi:hypothetical protein
LCFCEEEMRRIIKVEKLGGKTNSRAWGFTHIYISTHIYINALVHIHIHLNTLSARVRAYTHTIMDNCVVKKEKGRFFGVWTCAAMCRDCDFIEHIAP